MSWTKGQLVNDIFGALAIPNWEFDLDPEDIEYVLRTMDMKVASWGTSAVRIGYQLSQNPSDSDLDQASGIAEDAVLCVIMNVALAVAGRFGKVPAESTKLEARKLLMALESRCAERIPMQFDQTLPLGQGNKPWRRTGQVYFTEVDPLTVGRDSLLDF